MWKKAEALDLYLKLDRRRAEGADQLPLRTASLVIYTRTALQTPKGKKSQN
jgi:hypothetical protein